MFVLDVNQRSQGAATLYCTGRDIGYRQLELRFEKEHCLWQIISDTLESEEKLLPKEMEQFVDFMKSEIKFHGSNTELAEKYHSFCGTELSTKALKQMMNRWRYLLEDMGVRFKSGRSNGTRFVMVNYSSAGNQGDASDDSDGS